MIAIKSLKFLQKGISRSWDRNDIKLICNDLPPVTLPQVSIITNRNTQQHSQIYELTDVVGIMVRNQQGFP